MKNLVIVESPSKSKTIGKYLGNDYLVVSSKGHIRDLAIKGKDGLGVDVENDFTPTYIVSKDKTDTVKELKKYAQNSNNVFLATDPDREGEAISWHLAQELGLPEDAVDRVTFHEITKNAVTAAFQNPRKIDMALVHSQETRRILDRIIGFKLSKLLHNKIQSKSAGRVQSVALKLIVDREKEINAFVPDEYWTLDALFEKDSIEFNASLAKINGEKAELHNEEEAMAAYNACQSEFTISEIKSGTRKRDPKPPFITSTLQQEAANKLSFSSKRTMSIAQRLYEGIDTGNGMEGLITYMRTDSTRLSNVFINGARNAIQEEYGKEYLGSYKVKNDENAQDAHEAIRPTSLDNTPEKLKPYLTAEQYRLYKLIYARALSSLMAPARYSSQTVTLSQNGYDFTAQGSVLEFDGYLKIYKDYDSSKDVVLPSLKETEQLPAKDLKANQHFTEAPARYTEARLIKALEEDGIGRPSTYAMIIDTIQARGYVTLDKPAPTSRTRVFFPTEQGTLTTNKLDEYFSDIINVTYTAYMEKKLDLIAEGHASEIETLRNFYDRFVPLLDKAYELMEKKALEKVGAQCPDCGGDLVYRTGRYGKFISCINFPKCHYTSKATDGKETEKAEPTGKMCPDCGHELLKRKSRYGTYFLGCSNFPSCTYMESLNGEKIVSKKTSVAKKTTKAKKTTAKKTTTRKKKAESESVASADLAEAPKKKPAARKRTTAATTKKTTTRKKKPEVSE